MYLAKMRDERWGSWNLLFQALIFNRVRAENPKSLEKVVPVDGDISLDNFGLSEAHLKLVLEKVCFSDIFQYHLKSEQNA